MTDRPNPSGHSSSEPELERELSGFHDRLRVILERYPSSSAFSKKAGLSQSGFHHIRHGGYPTLEVLIKISNAAEVSLDWLVLGAEPAPQSAPKAGAGDAPEIDKWLFSRACEGVRRVYERAGVSLPTINEIELAADIYNRVIRLAEDQDARRGALLMALDQLERDLRTDNPTPQSSKRQA